MSTIALPALRKLWANLYRYVIAGTVESSTSSPLVWGVTAGVHQVVLSDVGLAPGDVVSASADIQNAVSGENTRLNLRASDSGASAIATSSSAYANNTAYTRHTVANFTIPANAHHLLLFVDRQSGAGAIRIRRGMINRGSSAAEHEYPKRGASVALEQIGFGMDGVQSAQRTTAGVAQITSFPSRLWLLRFTTIALDVHSDEFREWQLAMNQLSDLANAFRFVPPDYRGPSTGYRGPNPIVNGASQLGTSLVCDGVELSTPIVKAGDFASIEVTSPKGNTNVQLFPIAADAVSNGSGAVTLTLGKPIRQAPANDAVVQIFSPTTQFSFAQPRHETPSDADDFAAFSVDAIEQVYP